MTMKIAHHLAGKEDECRPVDDREIGDFDTGAETVRLGGSLGRYRRSGSLEFGACRWAAFGRHDKARRWLSASLDCLGAMFQGSGAKGTQRYRYDGQEVEGPGDAMFWAAEDSNWLKAMFMALAFRRTDILAILDGYSAAKLANPQGGEGDKYLPLMAEAVRQFHRKHPSAEALLEDAASLSQPENLRIAPWNYVAMNNSAIHMLLAILRHDQAALDAASVEAVNAHKRYFSRGQMKRDWLGMLAIPASGCAAVALDSGLLYNVDSDYTPRWLIERRLP